MTTAPLTAVASAAGTAAGTADAALMQTGFQTGVYWIGCLAMAAGAIAFGLNTTRARDETAKQLSVTLFFVPLIASVLYLSMALGQGGTVVNDRSATTFGDLLGGRALLAPADPGRRVVYVRYITWALTTPLLLVQIVRLVRVPWSTLLALIFADVFMIVTGGVAALSPKPLNWPWYLVSCGAFVAILVLLYRDAERPAGRAAAGAASLFRTLRNFTAPLWIAYPLVWALGPTGLSALGSNTETVLYTVLDVLTKVVFGFIILGRWVDVEGSGAPATTGGYVSDPEVGTAAATPAYTPATA